MFEDAITVLIGYFAELTDCFGNNTNPLVGFYFKEYIVHLSFDGSIGNGHTLYPERKELEEDDYYYIPSFSDNEDLFEEFSWESDSELCQFHLRYNLVYSTPGEAEYHIKALLNIKD